MSVKGVCGRRRSDDQRQRLPSWLRRRIPSAGRKHSVERSLASGALHTVCEEAACPNRGECFGRGTATFLILGSTCTRSCRFCDVSHGAPQLPDPDEPRRLVETARSLGLDYVVITSVTRDDLPDGGAGQFAAVVRALATELPDTGVEVLVPDFGGSMSALMQVLESGPDVLNHNVETVPRLYPLVRPEADFDRSVTLLRRAADAKKTVAVKSGMMVGLGERPDEVRETMARLADAGCAILTIGQYLQPSSSSLPVAEFVEPGRFDEYAAQGRELGIARVVAGPFVRSSYRAGETARALCGAAGDR
ncbi:MAG: lipoyl synthase [Chitinivibrionales bacterium]|nr:lipoyl synthase [Chitinivibrionales bacterium]